MFHFISAGDEIANKDNVYIVINRNKNVKTDSGLLLTFNSPTIPL